MLRYHKMQWLLVLATTPPYGFKFLWADASGRILVDLSRGEKPSLWNLFQEIYPTSFHPQTEYCILQWVWLEYK